MANSEASWNNDSGFYIGQTPAQTKPIRSIVANVKSYGNVLGFSGTNMRYVTITKSQWFNNGIGIVPNALDSEKYAPPEDNVITDNDIFWNNFNYYAGAPFKLKNAARPSTSRTRSASACCSSAVAAPRVEQQPHLRQLPGRASARCKQILLKQADAADLDRQPGQRQPVRLGRHRPQRPRPVLRRQRLGQLLRAQRRRDDDDAGGRLDVRPVPVHRAERVQPGRPRTRRSAGTSAIPRTRRSGSSTRTPPSPASRRWSTTRSEGPDRDRADRRRGPCRGAGRGRAADAARTPQKKKSRGRRQLLQPAAS